MICNHNLLYNLNKVAYEAFEDIMNYSDIREYMKTFFSDFELSNVADLILYD